MCLALEAGGNQEVLLVNIEVGKGTRGLGVELLEVLEEASDGVIAVDFAEGVVIAKKGIAIAGDAQRLEDHGAARRHLLDVSKHGTIPVHHLWRAEEDSNAIS